MQDQGRYFKLASFLLQYPDEAYFEALAEVKSAASRMHPGRGRAAIEYFIAAVENRSPIRAQEQYTALFDMNPSTTLNVTYHLWGDSEKRARLLAGLQQRYARAGLEKQSPELPDFLPLVLEFMATVPGAGRSATIQKSLEGIGSLVERLKPLGLHYSRLLEPLAAIVAKQAKDQTAAGVAGCPPPASNGTTVCAGGVNNRRRSLS
jgi:nitrate reductase delta subunit